MDPALGLRSLPQCPSLSGHLPHSSVRHQCSRPGPARDLEPGPACRPARPGQDHQGLPLRPLCKNPEDLTENQKASRVRNRQAEQPPLIETALTYRLTNARVESVNAKLRLITRRAFGFQSAEALIGLAMLALGGLWPPLPHMSNSAG